MAVVLDSEKELFATHPAYRNIAHEQGTKYAQPGKSHF